jgi:mannose-1-phosphate guanylyltransferase
VRALVLAAGLGERLRPLTLFLPKPLLPIAGVPVAQHTLRALRAGGCEAAALNLHHRGGAIERAFGDQCEGLPLVYSHEATLLGTLGPLHAHREFLGAADAVVLVNGDSLCRWPFARLLAAHRRSGAVATLLLSGRASVGEFQGGVGIDGSGRVVSLRDARPSAKVAQRLVFAGAHVLRPDVVAAVRPGPGDIIADLYQPLLKSGARLQAVVTERRWHDLGTPRRYLEAALGWYGVAWRGSRRDQRAVIEPGARVKKCLIEGGASVEKGAEVEASLLLAGAHVPAGAAVRDSILGPGVRLPPGATIEGRLVTTFREEESLRPQDSLVSGLVYSPMDSHR